MTRGVPVPITPAVLAWAIEDAGYSVETFAQEAGLDPDEIRSWLAGESKPGLTKARRLATTLKRPLAILLLPKPPPTSVPEIAFRHPTSIAPRALSPKERLWVRRARRLQESVSWAQDELRYASAEVPRLALSTDTEKAGTIAREWLGIDFEEQRRWKNGSAAFKGWRARLEDLGLLVLVLPLGKNACRGFSLPDESAPLVAINSAWLVEARIFSLLHELGHLSTDTASACMEDVGTHKTDDPAERWCESFAAAVLMPWTSVESVLRKEIGWKGQQVTDLEVVKLLGRRFKVSLRAAALRLINRNVADWSLFKKLPKGSEDKEDSGGGGGRDRLQKSLDEFGARPAKILRRAVEEEVITRLEALRQLNISDSQLDMLHD